MATGHLNPGYQNVVSRFHRSKSAHPSFGARQLRATMDGNVDAMTLDEIRAQARETWAKPEREETSYGDHFRDRFADAPELTASRPTSPTRRHKPHPSLWFLTARLHHCSGYHNADTTVRRDPYRVDASVPSTERHERALMKSKYVGKPSSAAIKQYNRYQEVEAIPDALDRQATEAWLNAADEKDRQDLLEALRKEQLRASPAQPAEMIPSVHRFGKLAGAAEASVYRQLHHRASPRPATHQSHRPNRAVDVVTQRFNDLEATRNVRYISKPVRGDFLMHPEWPPHFPAHKLPCLC